MGLGRQQTAISVEGFDQKSLLSALDVDYFTMCLGSIESGAGGRLELGAGTLERSVGSFVSTTATGSNAWATSMTAASAGKTKLDLANVCADSINAYGSCSAIIDSGTTLLVLPATMHEAFDSAIRTECPGCLEALQTQSQCDPAFIARLPNLSFTLGGHEMSLEPRNYMAPVQLSAANAANMNVSNHQGANQGLVNPSQQHVGMPRKGARASRREHAAAVHESRVHQRTYGGRHHPYRFVTADQNIINSSLVNGTTFQSVGCVPLISSTEEVPTDIGPLLILGMPFLRQYAVKFERASGQMSFAHLTKEESKLCNGCGADLASAVTNDMMNALGALQPTPDPADGYSSTLPATAGDAPAAPAGADTGLVSLDHLRFPSFGVSAECAAAGRPSPASLTSLLPTCNVPSTP